MKRPCSGEYCFLSAPWISRCSVWIETQAGLSCASAERATFGAAREAMAAAEVFPDAAGGAAAMGAVCAALAALGVALAALGVALAGVSAGAAPSAGTVAAGVG